MKHFILLSGLVLTILACQPKPRPIKLNKFEDIQLQKIYTYQYNRQPDSLISYLKSENPVYRSEAALSFSSIQDSGYLSYIYPLLNDPDTSVRINAAFSIGQCGAISAEPELIASISSEVDSKVKATKLEALGRVATSKGLAFIAKYPEANDTVKGGIAWGIYRAGLRNINSDEAQSIMLNYANEKAPFEARLASGHYFYRIRKYPADLKTKALLLSVSDRSPEIRMIYTRVLSGYQDADVQTRLLNILNEDSVYNVRISAINALKPFSNPQVYQAIWNSLQNDKHISVKLAAAQYIAASNIKPDDNLINYVQTEENEIIRATLLGAFMQNDIAETVTSIATDYLKASDDRFEKQLLIKSLLMRKENFKKVFDDMKSIEDRDFILSVAYTLNDMLNNGKIAAGEFTSLLSGWLTTNNPYLVRQAAWFTTKPGFIHSALLSGQLKDAFSKFENYKDKTIPDAIKKAIEQSQNGEVTDENWDPEYYEQPETFESFNWNKIVTIPSDLKIDVYTEKGKFTMQLMVEDAPFSVRHFVDLIKEDFFEGAPFYRVIPNYVKQAGGAKEPGFDALANERIRSEFNRYKFRSNVVVMASAGRDTESSHFAIMISPAPWNDNRYTVFGKITGNKKVVQHLMPGDLIYGMEILCKYKI
ncbi:peptidylprolyl isomerase [Saccharicrinis sp. FJH2]|uniref:peptidylprolyl isomerase n=1 Tax=Saccharicrinis sp. FJH65 TaxID=3344659 RepID=UPI0035F31D16